ncbi:hypothetical protein CXG81DRAFT_21433 [Caulochytrium protostelioides]|uniref:Malate dehydrogenase n=1 Tax=Caulochytrium protostelioides TaxID=1555241 RepID=A0A4P9WX23_9FUNG|nr:malate dehydrogenase [Caulochytrium protostelioides]RKO98317.1 hypothetical protein CXG81DRAFT_21433 [Caulochytrium protostelioides]|eukprot:RKO98317.1 hypothetical protein CXG81DRAFT_21433 [Caulochytrium protostelioides]
MFFSARLLAAKTNVAILGAAGGIGQPLSLLTKLNPAISNLALYDLVNTPGVAADLSHINTPAKVKGYKGPDELDAALKGADVVIIPAGVPRKPGMSRDDLFNTNAGIVKSLASAAARVCPDAHLLVIANPVNSTVPIVAEVFKKAGVYNPKRLFGVTTLDVVRASTFVAEAQTQATGKAIDPSDVKVTVIGGHSGVTILPILSQTGLSFSQEEVDALTHRIQFGGDEVVKAKDGAGSATLSMAQAGARFTDSLIRALNGEKNVVEPCFVESPVAAEQGIKFFASNVTLGKEGVDTIHPIGKLNAFEETLFEKVIPELKKNIQKGVEFANQA